MIRILLADDHTLVRRGVRLILEQEPDLSVVAEAADGAEAVERVRDTEVDLVVLDIAMPRMTGLQAAALEHVGPYGEERLRQGGGLHGRAGAFELGIDVHALAVER